MGVHTRNMLSDKDTLRCTFRIISKIVEDKGKNIYILDILYHIDFL